MRAGCLDCLVAAFNEYKALRGVPAVAATATARAARSAILAALRERELGIEESGYLKRAQDLAEATEPLHDGVTPLIDIADSMPWRTAGGRQINDEAQLSRTQLAYKNLDPWLQRLHPGIDEDPLSAYLWLGFNCAYSRPTPQAIESWVAELETWRNVPLLALKRATCGAVDTPALEQLLRSDERFVEVNYYLAIGTTLSGRLNEAAGHLQRAYAWRPRWPAVTTSLANLYLSAEEFEQALDFFDRTLAMVPAHPDALVGKIRALTYLVRHAEAIAVADQVLALKRWYIGDARYWRAFNEMQLGQNDEAWIDVEEAAKLLINAEVPKLAGIVAYRRKQIDVSRAKFEESHARNRLDCETGFYLGVVLAELAVWPETADVLIETGGCLEAAERNLNQDIEKIRQSDDPPARQERRIVRREEQIANGRRMMATSWFNIAVACYNLSRKDEARRYAEKIATDDQFGARARELLKRIR